MNVAHSWIAEVVRTVASEGKGIDEVAAQINRHKDYLHRSAEFEKRRSKRMKARIEEIIGNRLAVQFWNAERYRLLDSQIPSIISRSVTPYDAAEELLKKK